MANYTELLNISPEYVRIAFLMLACIGVILLFRFWKIAIVIATGAVGMYIAIKKSLADE